MKDLFLMLRITLFWCSAVKDWPKEVPQVLYSSCSCSIYSIFSVSIAVTWHWRKCSDNFWWNCVGSRKWLVNHCPLSHFAHGELAGLGIHWVVAVLSDSCGAQCLKLSSNVWHMVCVSLWPVTLVALNYPVSADWLCWRWGTGKGQSMDEMNEWNNEQHSVTNSATKWLYLTR